MAVNKTMRMELLSDLCTASGDGYAGYVDTDVCFNDKGVPYIPGKRLKGCLRECGLDIISVNGEYADEFKRLFGNVGELVPGSLVIGNGKLVMYDKEPIKEDVGDSYRSELSEVYTSIRTRTRIDNEGIADSGSLRTYRVLNKGQVYEFSLSLPDNARAHKFLEMCINTHRSMGLGRSRGLGEIKCYFPDDNQTLIEAVEYDRAFEIKKYGKNKILPLILELTKPTISAQRSGKQLECEDYLFGSAILGAVANGYIEAFKDSQYEEAYTDETFRRIFLDGSVRFTAAMPCEYINDTNFPEIYYPAPMTLKTNKTVSELYDESKEGMKADSNEKYPISKRLGGFISANDGMVKRYAVEKSSYIHHARPNDKGKGHADSDDGQMFTYEALNEKQMFFSSIVGSENDLCIIRDLLINKNTLRIGRSRTAQYGEALIKPTSFCPMPNEYHLEKGSTFRLVAVTPIILENEHGVNTTSLSVLTQMLGDDFKIVSFACAETSVSGYYGKWRLPRTQQRAITEGSVIIFEYSGNGTIVNIDSIGMRTNEGYGQVRFENIPEPYAFRLPCDDETTSAKFKDKISDAVQKLRTEKKAVSRGVEYGEKLVLKNKAPKNANMQRVITALRTSNSFATFAEKLDKISKLEQRIAALVFATDENSRYFRVDASRLNKGHIADLCRKHSYLMLANITIDYKVYKDFLEAAAQRIKQLRREDIIKRRGGDNRNE